jgi:glycosyltransferase involved in cell wall biosynthesis
VNDRSLAIVFPALNEEACIERAVSEALACGERLVERRDVDWFQVVVVDDGSTDGTASILQELSRSRCELVVVRHSSNRGLGAAIRSGLGAVDADLAFYTDADLPVDLEVVDGAVRHLRADSTIDAVSMYRLGRWNEGPRRFVYSIAYNALVRATLGLRLRDVNFAAKLVRMHALTGLELRSEGSFIDAELLARLERRGHRVAQLPAVYHPRSKGVSTLSSATVIRTILHELRTIAPDIRSERTVVELR